MLTKIATFALIFSAAAATAGRFATPVVNDRVEVPALDPPTAPPALPSRADVEHALAKRRAHNLAAFHAYRTGRVYPHNTYRTGPLNVWRDANGHLCAAATMIDQDGQHALVDKTATTNNNIRLLDVTSGPLLDWVLTSGFTLEEIDRIQAPMVMPERATAQQLAAEDAVLAKGYIATEAFLGKHAREDLELATTRLMQQPALAWALIRG